MQRKDSMDAAGAAALVAISLLFGINQVFIKVVNDALQPVFSAGLRSALALVVVLAWALWRGRPLGLRDGSLIPGLFTGLLFATEFLFLFVALDYTTVARVSIFFYSMPVWMTLGAHLLIPGERITPARSLGLALAMAGVVLAMAARKAGDPADHGSLLGDLLTTFAAMCWAGIGLTARTTRLARASSEMVLLYQLAVSAAILLPLSLAFGPLIRAPEPWHWAVFAVMVVGVAGVGFLAWFRILQIYPAAQMASYAFLTPVFGVAFGWLLLGERVGPALLAALALVSAGIVLINRPPRRPRG